MADESDRSERKRAIVTGGSGAIGSAICRKLAADGYFVAFSYYTRRSDALALAEELGGLAFYCDLADSAQTERAFDELGACDLIVNNAGVESYGLFQQTTIAERERIIRINLHGAMNCTALALQSMLERKQGVIINISSIWGVTGASCEVVYSASKAALIGFTKALAKEVAPSGIRVNCVAPGIIDTPMNARFDPTELAELGPIGAPEDVAELVAFLASERSKFITGEVINVTGGFRG